jgi:ABC-2 type transport system ATP-binding protein
MEQNIIETHNLTKKFGDFVAVDGINLSVERGKVFAFLGPNGAGKTTTIRMLTTLLDPTQGEIIINGLNSKHEKANIRKSFGIVFQDPSLDNELTAYENLDFHGVMYDVPKKARRERIEILLKFVGLQDRRNEFVKNFSGGMKRRLEIARGLIHHPKILFLDEPTIGLDPQTRNHLWEYIKKANKEEGMTVFLTTHYMEEAENMADIIAVIDLGKIVALGTSEELKKQTKASSLEKAFLELTGKQIREEAGTARDRAKNQGRMWGHR